jgi:hypothetical protein
MLSLMYSMYLIFESTYKIIQTQKENETKMTVRYSGTHLGAIQKIRDTLGGRGGLAKVSPNITRGEGG